MECLTSGPIGSWGIIGIITAVGYALGRVRPIHAAIKRWQIRRRTQYLYHDDKIIGFRDPHWASGATLAESAKRLCSLRRHEPRR